MKVYILTSGDYSEYSINAVYLDKEKAEASAESFNRGNKYAYGQIEEWEIEEELPVVLYGAQLRQTTLQGETEVVPLPPIKVLASQVGNYFAQIHSSNREPLYFWGNSYGKTQEQAEKALYDALAKAKAEHHGL